MAQQSHNATIVCEVKDFVMIFLFINMLIIFLTDINYSLVIEVLSSRIHDTAILDQEWRVISTPGVQVDWT